MGVYFCLFWAGIVVISVGNCAKFLVDVGLDVVILYERIYEIYGDILAASNCFKIDAYKQGMNMTAGSINAFHIFHCSIRLVSTHPTCFLLFLSHVISAWRITTPTL